MSGSLHDVKNSVWMKTVVISVVMLFVGVAGYATFAGGIGTIKHATWEEAEDKAHATEEVWQSYNGSNPLPCDTLCRKWFSTHRAHRVLYATVCSKIYESRLSKYQRNLYATKWWKTAK